MKNWTQPDVYTLNIEDTANGGEPSMDFDQQWFDEKGALHVNFKVGPEGDTNKKS